MLRLRRRRRAVTDEADSPLPPLLSKAEDPLELREHLHKSRLTSNAAVLLVWITLSVHQGRLEASYEDLMRGLGWSRKMLQRTIADLTQKGYIRVTRATSQRSKMLIEVLIDFEESPGVDKDVHTDTQESPVPDKDGHGGKSVVDKDVHDYNAATVDVDKGVHGIEESVPDVPSASDSKSLEIPVGCQFTDELSAACKDLLEFVGFACDRRFLSRGFIKIVEKQAKLRPWSRPGMLGSLLIERCLHWQAKLRKEGRNRLLYAWPVGFQKHASILRRDEREAGRQERARAA